MPGSSIGNSFVLLFLENMYGVSVLLNYCFTVFFQLDCRHRTLFRPHTPPLSPVGAHARRGRFRNASHHGAARPVSAAVARAETHAQSGACVWWEMGGVGVCVMGEAVSGCECGMRVWDG